MSAGNLIFLLVLVGGVVAMFSMHRGGGHSHGMGGCGGGHGHGGHGSSDSEPTSEESSEKETKPLLGKPGSHSHGREPATQGSKHSGC